MARERDVIEILVNRDLDREVERVATTRRRALGARRRLDAATALACVLLLFDLHDAIADFDHVDHLGRLELALHRREIAAAGRARHVRCVELEDLLHQRELRLRSVAEVLTLLALGLVGRRRRCVASTLGRWRLRALRELFDEGERLLKLLLIALDRRQFIALHAQQHLDLRLLRERHPAQLLDVALASQVHVRHDKFHHAVVDPLRDFIFNYRVVSVRSQPATARDGRQDHNLR